eukprot:74308-Lingulodinium_polyedra.AAC.1
MMRKRVISAPGPAVVIAAVMGIIGWVLWSTPSESGGKPPPQEMTKWEPFSSWNCCPASTCAQVGLGWQPSSMA